MVHTKNTAVGLLTQSIITTLTFEIPHSKFQNELSLVIVLVSIDAFLGDGNANEDHGNYTSKRVFNCAIVSCS